MTVRRVGSLIALVIVLGPRLALAQGAPIVVAPPPAPVEPPAVEWKAQAKGGFMFTAGNSQSTNGTLSVTASRKEGNNKLAFDGAVAYGRSNVLTPVFGDAANPMTITELDRRTVVSTNLWNAKGRYDRFFTPNNTGFASGLAGADKSRARRSWAAFSWDTAARCTSPTCTCSSPRLVTTSRTNDMCSNRCRSGIR